LQEKFKNVYRQGQVFSFHDGYDRITIRDGRATGSVDTERLQEIVAQVKKAYSRETIKASAKRFGWIIEQGQDEDHFAVIKR